MDGRFLPGYEDEFFATIAELLGEGIDVEDVPTIRPGRPRTTATWSTAMGRRSLAEDPDALVRRT